MLGSELNVNIKCEILMNDINPLVMPCLINGVLQYVFWWISLH